MFRLGLSHFQSLVPLCPCDGVCKPHTKAEAEKGWSSKGKLGPQALVPGMLLGKECSSRGEERSHSQEEHHHEAGGEEAVTKEVWL